MPGAQRKAQQHEMQQKAGQINKVSMTTCLEWTCKNFTSVIRYFSNDRFFPQCTEGGGMRGAFTSGVLDAFRSSILLTYTLVYLLVRPMLLSRSTRSDFNLLYWSFPEFIDYKRFFKGGDLLDLSGKLASKNILLTSSVCLRRFLYGVDACQNWSCWVSSKDNLLNALRASSSIPVLIPSILWVNHTLMAALQMLSLDSTAKWR